MYSSIWKRSTWHSSYRRSLDYSILEYAPVQRLSQVISGKQVCVYKIISSLSQVYTLYVHSLQMVVQSNKIGDAIEIIILRDMCMFTCETIA